MNARPYVIPADKVIGLPGTTPSGYTVTGLAAEHTTCLAAIEYNQRHGFPIAQDVVEQLRCSIVATLRAAGHEHLANSLAEERRARARLSRALVHEHADDLDDAMVHLQLMRRVVHRAVSYAEAQACTCVRSCADDPATACSLSGEEHVHPDDGSGTFGPCPVHPDAPGDR